MTILLFFIILAVLILSHEFGHFIVAKKSGIKVEEFAFGFPPRLFKFKKGETLYSFNLIPFGGFVKIFGEEGEKANERGSFASKKIYIRSAVIAAGVVFNLLLAWILLSGNFMLGMPTSVSAVSNGETIENARIVIVGVQKETPAEAVGLIAGDELIDFESMEEVQSFISGHKGQEIKINYKRGNEIFSVLAAPSIQPEQGKGALGIAMDKIGIVKLPLHKAVWKGLEMTANLTVFTAKAIAGFFVDIVKGESVMDKVAGPVGIVGMAGDAAKLGFVYILNFIALLSINLAVINIIPFPALDGGRLVFLLAEKIKGSPISHRFSSIVHTVGFALLLILMLMITYKDILRLI